MDFKPKTIFYEKSILTVTLILTLAIIFSFNTESSNEEITITVTSDKQTTFDMFQDSKIVKGLKTPYQMKIKSEDSRFIFKSKNSKTSLKIEAKKNGAELSATWPITVLLVNGDKLTTFGID